ncbi:MAG: serine/threonine-protein kinase [Phycisphaerae bacterium]|nr:serine/threonine-protein kinase [Phycisphaerae bacterium]
MEPGNSASLNARASEPQPEPKPEIELLRAAWTAAPPEPDIAACLTEAVRSDAARLVAVVRFDALERRRRELPSSFEHYRARLPTLTHPESPLADFLLGLELGLDRAAPAALKARLGAAFHAMIDRLATPPDDLTGAAAASAAFHAGSTAAKPPPSTEAADGPYDWTKGDRIGPFALRKRLGAGAFGEVWLARRDAPELDVAIKVLKPGVTDPDSVRRFAIEAQVLAFMEHRYVAKILDAGTARGLPYIAMEYIEGKPLVRYCDDRRLSLEQRLELVARICEGVQHAHQRGLIHRDLKPDNILVTEVRRHPRDVDAHEARLIVERSDDHVTVAVPKIVDFGLAKAVERSIRMPDGTLTVDLGKLMGTPEYMAPEQAGHQPQEVTQRADIFALGVILYELLAGTLPLTRDELRQRAMNDMVAVLRDTPRPEPSTRFSAMDAATVSRVSFQRGEISPKSLEARLHGRVRHVCGKAMRLEPERRFSSAAAMGTDIRNYLDDRDFIEAAAEPARERLARHLRRHRLPYITAAALIAALIAGVAGTTWQWMNARRTNRDLLAAAAAMQGVTETLFENLRARGAIEAADTQVLERARDTLRASLPPENATLLAIENELAGVYKWSGRFDDAEALYDSVGDRWSSTLPSDHSTLIQVAFNRAIIHTERGKRLTVDAAAQSEPRKTELLKEADHSYEQALTALVALRDGAAAALPKTSDRRFEIESEIALALTRLKRYSEAIDPYRRALDGMRSALPGGHWRIADTAVSFGVVLMRAERSAEAATVIEEALGIYRADPNRGPAHPYTLQTASLLAGALQQSGRCDAAWVVLRETCEGMRRASGKAPTDALAALGKSLQGLIANCDDPEDVIELRGCFGVTVAP